MGRPTVLQSASLLTYPPPRGSPHFDRMMERRTEEKYACIQASLVAQMVKNPCNVGDLGSVPGLGRSPGWHGTATHSSILAWSIPMDRGAWQSIVHGLAKLDTTEQLSTTQHVHACTYKLKSRDITLAAKICVFNAMVYPVVMYKCKSWIMKTEH